LKISAELGRLLDTSGVSRAGESAEDEVHSGATGYCPENEMVRNIGSCVLVQNISTTAQSEHSLSSTQLAKSGAAVSDRSDTFIVASRDEIVFGPTVS
jgi:hypothetical protein